MANQELRVTLRASASRVRRGSITLGGRRVAHTRLIRFEVLEMKSISIAFGEVSS
jgi:hypothetical protein